MGDKGADELLVLSQVILSMQLGFAIWPLMRFTSDPLKMGEFANAAWLKILGWLTVWLVIVLNVKLLFDTIMPDAVQKCRLRRAPSAGAELIETGGT